ncbi:MAG: nucleotide exchange factor GrpE [Rhodospirillaceae bacterium]|jgi:molecular chaperone GrpE
MTEDQKDDQPEESPEEQAADETPEDLDAAISEEISAEAAADDAAEEDRPPTYEELASEIAALKDQLLRALAEAENVRRRTEREKADASKYAIANFARSVLSVADNLRRAMESVGEEARQANEDLNNLYVGIEMTANEIDTVYEQFGIKPVEALGKKFDHNFHQAMFEIEDPSRPAGMVVQEMQRGYVIQDRLLRPAMVGVSKGGPKMEEPKPEEAPVEDVAKGSDKAAGAKSSAYAKQSDAADREAEGASPEVVKEL